LAYTKNIKIDKIFLMVFLIMKFKNGEIQDSHHGGIKKSN